ncbi:MAG: GPW/gp25 family protein [Bacteroidia bacterium]|nr:GPW/gp25 family protein [Bacteroidia bacterium]
MNSSKAFLGRGWSFPPSFVKESNIVEMAEAEQDIRNSLFILLSTTVGERIMQPEYGSQIHKLVFEPIDTTFSTFMTEQIRTAVLYFEPRITLENIEYIHDNFNSKVDLKLNYSINGTNKRNNLVYPFYINEATDTQP